jgi:cold shock CspA family protein
MIEKEKERKHHQIEQRSYEGKSDSVKEKTAYVIDLVPKGGYGFIKTLDGREVYFNRNDVPDNDFESLKIGMGVLCTHIKHKEDVTVMNNKS